MRSMVLAACWLVGCSNGGPPPDAPKATGARGTVRPDLHCTLMSRDVETACLARGSDCLLGPPLQCGGAPPTGEVEEKRRAAYEAASLTCECSCQAERDRCNTAP